jgi:hypothetical protein
VPRRIPADRGSAAVEFALLLPILLLVLLGLVQVGVMATDQLLVVQASRAGAREASVQASVEAVDAAARSAAAGLDESRLDVEATWGAARGDPVTVIVAYEMPVSPLLAGWLLPESVTLHSEATMRREFP